MGAYAGWNALDYRFSVGGWDDSLSFDLAGEADIDLVWLDAGRLTQIAPSVLAEWLLARLHALRSATTNPVVVAITRSISTLRNVAKGVLPAAVNFADMDCVALELGERWLDARTAALTGSILSNAASLRLARELACRWLPACVLPARKAIVVDLDDTLYRGVLGEDGPVNVELTEGHCALQQQLRDCKDAGILLALVSHNERSDVEEVFAMRVDFPLRLDDFAAVEVSWQDKGESVDRIASALRVGTDSMIYIDDNPGELASVASGREIFTIYAAADARQTSSALAHCAGLFRWQHSTDDGLRIADLFANRERATLADVAPSREAYLRELQVRLEYLVAPRENIGRLADLSGKTNQFNLSLRRFNAAELARRLDDPDGRTVAIRLSDRLSDSGIVAGLVGRIEGSRLHIEDLFVSCRALGRGIEDLMLCRALALMPADMSPPTDVVFDVATGPRNQPARDWLARYAHGGAESGTTRVSFDVFASRANSDPILEEVLR